MILELRAEIHQQLQGLAAQGESFDGGDQGTAEYTLQGFPPVKLHV
jgi:hypothetical protein